MFVCYNVESPFCTYQSHKNKTQFLENKNMCFRKRSNVLKMCLQCLQYFDCNMTPPTPLPTCTSRCRSPAGHQKLPTAHGNPNVDFVLSPDSFLKEKKHTLQGTNISHLGKRKIIFKMPFLGDMLVFRGVFQSQVAEFSILSGLLRCWGWGWGLGFFLRPHTSGPEVITTVTSGCF